MCRSGREKTTQDSEYIQLNPLAEMTTELFKKAIAERRVILQAKDKYRSTAAIMHCNLHGIQYASEVVDWSRPTIFNDFTTFKTRGL